MATAKKATAPAKPAVAAVKAPTKPVAKKAAPKAKVAKAEVDLSKFLAGLVGGKLTEAQRAKLREEAKRRKITVTALQAAILAAFIEQL